MVSERGGGGGIREGVGFYSSDIPSYLPVYMYVLDQKKDAISLLFAKEEAVKPTAYWRL